MNLLLLLILSVDKDIAVIIKAKGDVKIYSTKGTSDAKNGYILKIGDEIKTGKDGFAVIRYLDKGSIIEIMPLSSVSFPEKVTRDTKKVSRIKLFFGEIISIIKGKSFEVETPNSIASVKGTHFRVSQIGDTTTVDVISGIVSLSNENGTIEIGEGESGRCIGSSEPSKFSRPKKIIIEFEDENRKTKYLEMEIE
jgi:hypothetical protein